MFTPDHIRHLEYGTDYGGGFTQCATGRLTKGGRGWYEAGAAWDLLGPQILRSWINREGRNGHGGFATRPYAWWLFVAPERRRCTNGVRPFDNPKRTAHFERHGTPASEYLRLYYGVPNCSAKGEGFNDFELEYETEREYIARLNLWLPGEKLAKS